MATMAEPTSQLSQGVPPATASFDGPTILASLKSLGLATDLSSSDLSLSLASSSKTASTSASSSSSSSSNSSLSMLLSRLSLLLSDLSRLIDTQIKSNLALLLAETSRIQGLQSGVHDVRSALTDVQSAVAKVRGPAQARLKRLQRDQVRLRRLCEVQGVLKGATRFVLLARRLERNLAVLFDEGQGQGEHDNAQGVAQHPDDEAKQRQRRREEALVRSARAIEAIADLVEPRQGSQSQQQQQQQQPAPSTALPRIAFVQAYLPSVAAARNQVLDLMEHFIVSGLRDLSPSTLSSSLLTASVLGVLPDLVRDLMSDLTDVVRRRVEVAWQLRQSEQQSQPSSSSSSAVEESRTAYASYKPRQRGQAGQGAPNMTTTATTAALDGLLARLETLFAQELAAVCSKIYLLQRVLGLMRDGDGDQEEGGSGEQGESRRSLLDKGIETLDDQTPTSLFWQCLAQSLSSSRQALPPHLQQALRDTPAARRRLAGVVSLFFEKTSIWTGIEDGAQQGQQGGGGGGGDNDDDAKDRPRPWEVQVVRRSVGLA